MDNKEKIRLAINQIPINNCDGSANEDAIKAIRYLQEVSEALTLTDVSQQREPLFAYHKHLDSFNDPTIYNASESLIDDYLANNCG